ncbi:hypothetical protein Tco_0368721 [Tanacetum coccineum]
MYKEYLAEFWYSAKTLENSKVFFSIPTGGIYGKVGVNTFRNVIGAHYLPHSSEYVAPPFIDIVRPWFKTIGYGEVVPAKRTLKKVFFLLGGASFIIHFESASGNDASAASITKANPGNFAPRDFVPQQQGMNKGTKNTSYDYLFAETSTTIKLEDLAKLVSHVQPSFKDLDSPEDDPVIVVGDSDEDEDDEVHATKNVETKDTLVPKSLSPISLPTELKDLPSKLNKLTGEVKGLKKKVHELEIELPGDLKEIPTKLDDFTKNVTSLTSQVAELKTLQWELSAEFLSLPAQVASVQAKLKTLDALPSLLLTVTQALNKFAQVLNFASSKAGDQSVLLVGQADTMPAEGEKNTNQATIS